MLKIRGDDNAFWQRLQFYTWLLQRSEDDQILEYARIHGISPSNLSRWKRKFSKERFSAVCTEVAGAQNIRTRIIAILETLALAGNVQAAKFVLDLEIPTAESEVFTIDKALKLLRELT